MSYETEEQQVEQLKEWWRENGTPLIVGAVLGLSGFAGWKYWNQKQIEYQEGASDLYLKVEQVLKDEKQEGLVESALAVKSKFPESSYAIMAAFHIAKKAVEDKDYDKAVAELTWVVDNHKGNDLVPLAKIRLARVLMQQDKPTEALPLVESPEDSGYSALASLVKGDVLMALDRKEEALAAFKIANADQEIVSRHPSLKFKIDALSHSSAKIVSTETEAVKDTSSVKEVPVAEAADSNETVAADTSEEQEAENKPEESK